MTPEFFESQMFRLKTQFGEKAYGQERMKLIYNAVKTMPDYWMSQVVCDFLGSSRQAPLLKEFVGKIADYQEQRRIDQSQRIIRGGDWATALEKTANKSPNRNFAKECTALLRRKINKEITDEEFQGCLNLLGQVAKKENADTCDDCMNSGYATRADRNGYQFVYRCHCKWGGIRPDVLYGVKRQDGAREECPIARVSAK